MGERPVSKKSFFKRRRVWLAGIYILLLIFSGVYRWTRPEKEISPEKKIAFLNTVDGNKILNDKIRVTYKEFRPAEKTDVLPVVLIHGSPGDADVFDGLAKFVKNRRLIAIDLPGFGDAEKNIPDYSIRAHARYVIELLDELEIEKAHFAGFSLGGGVILEIENIAPNRIESISMISAIGVQEYELLGNYQLNHAIHGFQVAALWALQELTPHFGIFDGTLPYARNFYDTDQRPLRARLEKTDKPFQIIHGKDDFLVPIEAAREHFRLVPQSEFIELDDNHFFIFMRPEKIEAALQDFWARAENGQAKTRETAAAERIIESEKPFEPQGTPARGVTAFVYFVLIALATFVSEDLACLTAGALAAQGRFSYLFAVLASLFGIFIGDVGLFLAGRIFGRRFVKIAPFRWFISERAIERSSHWFEKNGVKAIFLSRFIPGLRLPTYLAAGILHTNFLKFTFYFLLAAAAWTPLLVGFSYLISKGVLENPYIEPNNLWIVMVAVIISLYIVIHLLMRLTTHRGRRLLAGKIGRLRHWEFWPPYVFYPPVLLYVAYLALKYRGLTVFTCANPAIEAGGFIGESKNEIYQGLNKAGKNAEHFLRYVLLKNDLETAEKLASAREFLKENDLNFPCVLKPDTGERGTGVFVLKNEAELEKRLAETADDAILQEYGAGDEFGVFYYRFPEEEKGKIFAITEKRFPEVTGTGETTLENLILDDERAVCLAHKYFERNEERLEEIPAAGEQVRLVDIGTHARGAVFLDGIWIKTIELETAIDRICRNYEGFYFGRFDIRTPSVEDFQKGKNFKIVELNGVTSEATSIYDRKNGLFEAYRILFKQWRIAFEIGAQNRRRGAKPVSIFELGKLIYENW